MASDLYEVLDLTVDATPEQIRRAYKVKALRTHPDRLPPTATPAEKAASEEQFRKVNNAYEVLYDPVKRKEYDLHGVWPPPEPESEEDEFVPRPSSSRHRGYSRRQHHAPRFHDPFFGHNHSAFSSFVFSDPFALFDAIFGDEDMRPHRPTHYSHHHRSAPSRFEDPFERMQREMNSMMSMERDFFPGVGMGGMGMMGGFPTLGRLGPMAPFPSIEPSSFDSGHGQWTSESFMTTSVNGVTQTIHKRRDWDGNEHVTRTYPDGRELHTINGIEQPSASRGYLPHPGPNESRHLPQPTEHRHLPPPPPQVVNQANMPNTVRSDYALPPPPPYPGHTGSYNQLPHLDSRRRSRRSSDKHAYGGNANPDPVRHEERHHKKRWWPSGW